jgi:hypothetical protein
MPRESGAFPFKNLNIVILNSKKMNAKKTILILLMAGFSTVGLAQFKVGVKAGLNIAGLKGTQPPSVTAKQKIGFHGGVTGEYVFLNPKFSLMGELLYSTQGSITEQSRITSNNGTYAYEDEEARLNTTNINLPIMLKYYVLDKLSIEGGPQFGLTIKAQKEIETTNSADPSLNSTATQDGLEDGFYNYRGVVYPYKKFAAPFEIGLVLGAGYDFSDKIYMQVHYNFGITDTDPRGPEYLTGNTNKFTSSVFQVALGYKFN